MERYQYRPILLSCWQGWEVLDKCINVLYWLFSLMAKLVGWWLCNDARTRTVKLGQAMSPACRREGSQ